MGKRGPKPKEKVLIAWTAEFAYAIGLIASDGSLSKDGRHITLVSKDAEQLVNFMSALHIVNGIDYTRVVLGPPTHVTTRVQFSDVLFYQFLIRIGLMPNKSKVIGAIDIPEQFFFDFLRGSFDGDGCTYSYFDSRWKSSFMCYTVFTSASFEHICWIQREIKRQLGISGHVTRDGNHSVYQLRYAKKDSQILLPRMYYRKKVMCLTRKRLKIEKMLRTIGQRL